MKRAIVALILAMCLVASVLTYLNDKATNSGLPLVHAALKDYPRDHMLFSPCPGGQFAPRPKRNIA
jgi:hypothetical protein